jgi:hypothetical protein
VLTRVTLDPVADQPILAPELVPEPLWYLSGQNLLPRRQWQAIRAAVIAEVGSHCSACAQPIAASAICHEMWSYENDAGIARLLGLTIICRPCNGVHHFGQASVGGWLPAVFEQLESVNGIDHAAAKEMLRQAKANWRSQSARSWTIRVEPPVLERFSELACLVGIRAEPGDGRARRAASRRA